MAAENEASASVVGKTHGESDELQKCLEDARKAYEEDDSQRTTELCRRALELDPDNAQAWGLLARFGGWDSKLYGFDIDFAVDSAKHALSLLPEEARYGEAAEIYLARKRQIALLLEAAMMTPSYTGAKQVHEIMQWWQRLLVELPCLNSELLEGEVALCTNLCARSRMGIMPGDRLVYTAYSSLNGKVPYGDQFREALQARLASEAGKRDEALAAAQAAAQDACAQALAHVAGGDASQLQADLDQLNAHVEALQGLLNRGMYQQQVEELEAQRAKLPKYKLFKVREADARLADLKQKLAEIDAQLAPAIEPLEQALGRIREALNSQG